MVFSKDPVVVTKEIRTYYEYRDCRLTIQGTSVNISNKVGYSLLMELDTFLGLAEALRNA